MNACPPGAGSCFVCPHYQLDGRGARREEAEAAARVRARIFDLLASAPAGLTFEEVARALGANPNTVRARLSYLEREGVVRRRNARRRVSSGRRAALYVVTEPRPVVPSLVASGALRRAP